MVELGLKSKPPNSKGLKSEILEAYAWIAGILKDVAARVPFRIFPNPF